MRKSPTKITLPRNIGQECWLTVQPPDFHTIRIKLTFATEFYARLLERAITKLQYKICVKNIAKNRHHDFQSIRLRLQENEFLLELHKLTGDQADEFVVEVQVFGPVNGGQFTQADLITRTAILTHLLQRKSDLKGKW